MFPSSPLLTLLSILATVHALPQAGTKEAPSPQVIARSSQPTFVDSHGNTIFAPNWATCANDNSLSGINNPPSTSTVTISDCDAAIEAICVAADSLYKKQVAFGPRWAFGPSGIGKTVNTCEAHMSFSMIYLADPLTHDSCVASFQQISVPCMVIGSGKYAAAGKQAGVMNMVHTVGTTGGCNSYPTWGASKYYSQERPGYAIAQAGYFGDICGLDPSDPLFTSSS